MDDTKCLKCGNTPCTCPPVPAPETPEETTPSTQETPAQ